jgi:transposase
VGIPRWGGHLTQAGRPGKEFVHHGRFTPAVVAGVQAGRGGVGAVSGRPISAVARELGCGESSLGYWLTKDRQSRAVADPERFAAEQAESEEIKRLRRRVAELDVEREILKRSAAWWVKESMP